MIRFRNLCLVAAALLLAPPASNFAAAQGGNTAPVATSVVPTPAASVRFDAIDDELFRTTNLPPVDGFTMMGWFRFVGFDSTNPYSSFLRLGDAVNSNGYNLLRCCGVGWNPQGLYLWNGAGIKSAGAIAQGTWYHLAVVVDGTGPGQFKLYRDGALALAFDGNVNVTSARLSIGNDAHNEWLDGNAASVKIYDVALTQGEIAQEMGQFTPVRTAGLNSWYPLQSEATAADDFSGFNRTLTKTGTTTSDPAGPPLQVGLAYVTPENTPVSGFLQATDADNDPLIYSIVANGTLGSAVVTDPATGAFTYTPNTNQSGVDTFTFVANDGTVDSNVATITVVVAAQMFPLTVTVTGSGSVSSAPAGITCPAGACTASYARGTAVTLTATANAGSVFSGWSGGSCGTSTPCVTTVDAATSVTATFAAATRDLTVTGVSAPPGTASPGTVIPLSATIANQGTVSTVASTTRFYLSLDGTKDPGDILFSTTGPTPALAAGASATVSVSLTVPNTTPAAVYQLLACADDTGVVAESSETNNCASAGTVDVRRADLVESSVSNPPANAAPGGTFPVTDTVQNIGQADAVSSTTYFYLSVDNTKSADDIAFVTIRSVPLLAPGATSTGTVTLTVPPSTPLGTYKLLACADQYQNRVIEADETNNCLASTSTVVVARPDLAESGVSLSTTTAAPGAAFTVTDTVENRGAAPAGASTTRYYLSLDGQKANATLLAVTKAVPAIAAGGASTAGKTVNVPANQALADYIVLACADDLVAVVESDEANNCAAAPGTLRVGLPDLVTTSLSALPADVVPGKTLTLTDTVLNQGVVQAAGSTARMYLSLDGVKDATDVLLTGVRTVPALAPGASSAGSRTLTVPSGTTPAVYVVLACADDVAGVAESNETNNCLASAGTIRVGYPDLVTSAVGAPPAEIAPGANFSVTETVLNQGDVAAAASTSRVYLSLDTAKDASDALLTITRAVPSLVPGASSAGTRTVAVPATLPAGAYYLIACADDTLQVSEGVEDNNCAASSGVVQVRYPDLIVTAVGNPPATVSVGGTFTASDTVANVGAIGVSFTYTRYYLSVNGSKTGATLLSGPRGVAALAVGASHAGTRVVTVPSMPSGTYFLVACAEDTGIVVESNEANNCLASATTTVVP